MIPHADWTRLGIWGDPARFRPGCTGIVVHHTVTKATHDPVADAQTVERVTFNRGTFAAVPYSYLLHPSGIVLGGRQTDYQNGANRNDRGGNYSNTNTVSLSLIGDYRTDQVTAKQRRAFWQLIDELKMTGAVTNDALVMPHSTVAYTECPSAAFDQLNLPTPSLNLEEDQMQTLVSKTTGEAWVVAGNRARPLSDVDQWLATFDGPVISANNMEHVVKSLYDVTG